MVVALSTAYAVCLAVLIAIILDTNRTINRTNQLIELCRSLTKGGTP